MNDAERLARAVLLFYSEPPWTMEKQREWQELTGNHDGNATTKTLCDLAREMVPRPDVLTAIDGEGTADLWALGEQIAKAEEVCAQEYTAFGKANKEAEDRLMALKAQLLRAGGKP